MKDEILQIAYSLEKGKIDERIAKQELCVLLGVSDSYVKCWNCKHFTQTSTKHANKEVGNCGLHKCKVTDPKWQKCGEYDQCGLLTTFNFHSVSGCYLEKTKKIELKLDNMASNEVGKGLDGLKGLK